MKRELTARVERWPLREPFVLSRGAVEAVEVVVAEVREGAVVGRGECRPYARYGATPASVLAELRAAADSVRRGLDRAGLPALLAPGAARNALDCALLDLEARRSGTPAWRILGVPQPGPLVTAYTISLADADAMAAVARRERSRPLLKLKLGGAGDERRVRAVREAAPDARLIVDANEAWHERDLEQRLHALAALGVAWVEQPLPADHDEALARITRPVPVCADESCHTAAELHRLADRYDAVNVKLDKTGGPAAALELIGAARARGMGVLVGCMVGTSLAMAPAALIAGAADFVDLDGPLLLARDRDPGLRYAGSLLLPDEAGVFGAPEPRASA